MASFTVVKAFSKSITVNGQVIFPLTDPKHVAKYLEPLIRDAENAHYRAGYHQAQMDMRRILGVK